MESDGLGLDLALLNVDLVTAENNGNVLADTDEITYDESAYMEPWSLKSDGCLRCQLGTFL